MLGWFVSLTVFLLVHTNNAQIPVTVTFDPPSPVPEGVTTFRCDFTLSEGSSLLEQYWATIDNVDVRFFTYQPGSEPEIDPDFENKIIGFATDDTTYLEIFFNVTACDTQTYLCNVLDTNTNEGNDQASLAVENFFSPTLKYGDEIIESDTTRIHTAPETVSCELYNAGPPMPEALSLSRTEGDGGSGVETTEKEYVNATCVWSFPVVPMNVNDLTDTATFRCRATYSDTVDFVSPVLTLLDGQYRTKRRQNFKNYRLSSWNRR